MGRYALYLQDSWNMNVLATCGAHAAAVSSRNLRHAVGGMLASMELIMIENYAFGGKTD